MEIRRENIEKSDHRILGSGSFVCPIHPFEKKRFWLLEALKIKQPANRAARPNG